jgi:hypothetical protein
MTLVLPTRLRANPDIPDLRRSAIRTSAARLLLAVIVCVAIAAGFLATGSLAASMAEANAGSDLTRLLRAMAAIKALMAGGAVAAVAWRLSAPITTPWLGAYALACAAMAAGPGLIWNMAHIGWGAAILHAGLLACAVLLWRDPAVAARLAQYVAEHRSKRGG